ncbi:MAG TPA: hypothetical protein VFE58_00465 [Tepidisphaeraceae bacterium]|nr:hypothetical protein [Tepidisphaeraceae bacterium]
MAIGDRECAVAEVTDSRGALAVTRVGMLTLGAEGGVDRPQAFGEALKKFLKEKGFSGSKVVVGLPAKWLTSRERQVPPSSMSVASAMLRLQAERQFPPELKDLVFDYAGKPDGGEARTVLLLAASRQQVERAAEGVRLAGLTPVAVTSSALALSAVTGSKTVLSVTHDAAELVVRGENGPRVLRHVGVSVGQMEGTNGVPAVGIAALGSELRRTVAVSGNGVADEVMLFDGMGLEPAAVTALAQRANLQMTPARNLMGLDVSGAQAASAEGVRFGPAVALALAGLRGGMMPADFLHTKLAPPKERKIGRRVVWGTIAAVMLVGAIGYPIYDLYSTQGEIDGINADISSRQDQSKAAEAMASKLTTAEGWYATKPPVLECLKHVTQAFPQEGTIWATNFTIRENGKGTLAGKAINRQAILMVRDFLMNDSRFSDVQQQQSETREAPGAAGANSRDRDTSFTITFMFKEGS